MTHVDVFIGCQCHGNPGEGTWAAVLRVGRHEKVLSGTEPHITPNRLELHAFAEALRVLVEPCDLTVHSAGRFLPDGFARWWGNWSPRGWLDPGKRPVNNADDWYALITLAQPHAVSFAIVAADANPAMAQIPPRNGEGDRP